MTLSVNQNIINKNGAAAC